MTKHTPSPWRLDTQNDRGGRVRVYGPPHPVDGGNYAPLCETSNLADALLMFAAPQLLKALERLVHDCGNLANPLVVEKIKNETLPEARTAIAAATGEEDQ